MAVTVLDNRTVLDQADAVTNFNTGTVLTSEYAESTGSIGEAYNIATGQTYFNGTVPNFTTAGNELIYLWSACIATQNAYNAGADASHAMWLSDGTNELVIYMAGNDRDAFKHSLGQVTFQCFMVDVDYLSTLNTAGGIHVLSGSFANFVASSISQVGAHYVTLSKALGGGYNCYIDIIRYGTEGISIYGGGSGTEGKFSEIAVEDRSTANLKAHGIIREYTSGAYGVQGTLKFGTDSATGNAYFLDSGVSITYEDRPVADDKFKFVVQGNSTDTNDFRLSNASIASARPGITVDMSSTNIDVLILNTVTFQNLKNAITFPSDSASFNHSVNDCTVSGCAAVDMGTVDVSNLTVSDTTETVTGSVYLSTSTNLSNQTGLTFNGYASNNRYALYIPASVTGTITLTDYEFDSPTSVYCIYWAGTEGTLTINKAGSTNVSTSGWSSAGGTVTISASYTHTIEGLELNTEVTYVTAGTSTELFHVENATTSDGSGKYKTSYTHAGGANVDILIFHVDYQPDISNIYGLTLPSSDATVKVQMFPDDNYYNPA